MPMNTMFGAPPPIENDAGTLAWRAFPFKQSTALSDVVMNQPRNLVVQYPTTRGVFQVLSGTAFGTLPQTNLVLPIPAQIRGSTVQGWLVQQLLANQNKLPGRP